MKKVIDFFVANPAGNITAFVTTPVDRGDYKLIAGKIFDIHDLAVEQVGFIKENSMEMCGLEFCGNASRSYALYLAKKKGLRGRQMIDINVSGSDETLCVEVDTDMNYTKIKMPLPVRIMDFNGSESGRLVDLNGIMHLILFDIDIDADLFSNLKDELIEKFNPPAVGVMFYNTKKETLDPVVYVKDVDTTYFEGSCGSGSTALAIALSENKEDGCYTYSFKQPAGTILVSVEIENKEIHNVYIEGTVDFNEALSITI